MSDRRAGGIISRSTALHLASILILGFLAYSNTFDVPFVYDDVHIVAENPLIADVSNIPFFFAGKEGPFASRPLIHATFALNYHFGGFDTTGYHVANLAIHLVNAILLYILVLLTGKHLDYKEERIRLTAFASSLLFAIHPALTEGVLYIASRSVLFATTFYLLGTILFLKAATARSGRGLYTAGLFLASLLGIASRENFATFPVMLLIYDLLFVSQMKPKEVLRKWKTYLPVCLTLAYGAFLISKNTYDRSADFAGVGIAHKDYLLTQFNVHWTYLRLLALPINQTIDYDYPIAQTLFERTTALSFLGYIGLWAGSIALAKKHPLVTYSTLLFLIPLIPISFVVALLDLRLDDVMVEHRLYLPSVGLFVICGAAASVLFEKLSARRLRWAPAIFSILFILMLISGTVTRNAEWDDRIRIWQDATTKAPGKARPHLNLGVVYASEGLNQEAIEQFELASRSENNYLHINKQLSAMYHQMGSVYLSMGLVDRAIDYYRMAVILWPRDSRLHISLANAYAANGDYDRAIENLNTALVLKPETPASAEYYVVIHKNLASAYQKKGLEAKAREHFRIAEDLKRKTESADE